MMGPSPMTGSSGWDYGALNWRALSPWLCSVYMGNLLKYRIQNTELVAILYRQNELQCVLRSTAMFSSLHARILEQTQLKTNSHPELRFLSWGLNKSNSSVDPQI